MRFLKKVLGGLKIKEAKNLRELLSIILTGEISDREMSSLPTFGGAEPDDTHGIFSWDKDNFLVQTTRGWEIVSRREWRFHTH